MIKNIFQSAWFYITALTIIFVGPIVMAWLLYYFPNFIPTAHSKGQLIQPTLSINKLTLLTETGQKATLKDFGGDWVLLYIDPKKCDSECFNNLYKMRQIKTALGKDSPRVERMIITLEGKSTLVLEKYLQNQFKGTLHVTAKTNDLKKFLQTTNSETIAMSNGCIYLMDPLGNIMLSYPPTESPRSIYSDLKHLIKASRIG